MASASRRFRRKKKREPRSMLRQFLYGGIALIIACLLGYGVWYVTRLPFFTIQKIEVSGGETVPHSEVETLIFKELEGNYFFLIPKQFVYLYPKEAVERAFQDISRISNFEIETTDRNTISISFEEYIPHALWCAEINSSVCIFLSQDGYAFEEAPPLRGGALIRYIQNGVEPQINVEAYDLKEITRTQILANTFEREIGLRVHTIERTEALDEVYYLAGGARLFVAPDISAEQTSTNLLSVLQSPQFAHISDGEFDYIDLRFGSRVFVQEYEPEKEEEVGTTTDEAEESIDL